MFCWSLEEQNERTFEGTNHASICNDMARRRKLSCGIIQEATVDHPFHRLCWGPSVVFEILEVKL